MSELVKFLALILVSEDIRLIYHVHGARDLRETRICIINTVLEINQPIFTTTIVYYMISH